MLFMKRLYMQTHKPISFLFRQTSDDFIVNEVPLEREGGKGSYLIIKVKKRNMTTNEMLGILEDETQCYHIGYAGLKDKSAMTTQYLSFPLKYSRSLEKFRHPQIQIIDSFRYNEKINMGDLKGNHFFIRLHKVSRSAASELERVLSEIQRYGMPNYFGYQRFGKESADIEKTREIAHGELDMADRRLKRLLSHAYQSYLFNDWLVSRVTFSRRLPTMKNDEIKSEFGVSDAEAEQLLNQPGMFKAVPGDIMLDHKMKKWVNVTDLQAIRKPFKERKLTPTGLLSGKKAWRAKAMAAQFEAPYDDPEVVASAGDRRVAWIYPIEIRSKYVAKEGDFELSFMLPKGAYATVLLENLANRELG